MHIEKPICALLALVCASAGVARGATTIGTAIGLVGNRLVANQTAAGSWPSEPDYTGAIISGMGSAYLVTGTPAYQTATLNGANFVLSNAQGNFLGDEAYGLSIASQVSANPLSNPYRSAINTFYNVTIPATPNGGTSAYISNLVNAYTQAFGEQSQVLVYLAEHTVAAAYVNSPDLPVWRAAVISTLAQVDDSDFYPVQASGVALWALAKTGTLDNTVISTSGFWAGKTLANLPSIIAGRQITTGADTGAFYRTFTTNSGDYTEDAVFSLLGLSIADPVTYGGPVLADKNWLANLAYTSGANQGMFPDNAAAPSEVLNAITGEGLHAMSAPLPVLWKGGTGNWSDAVQWNISPNVPDNDFTNGIFYDVTINGGAVTLDSNRVIRVLTINSGSLSGTANLQTSGGVINGTYNVTGTTTILAGTLIFGGTTQTAGPITGGGNLLVNTGATLTSDGITVSGLVINGAAQIRANGSNSGTSKVSSITIAHTGSGTSSTYTGKLNLANNRLVVEATGATDKTSKIASLNEAINAGANGLTWTGAGITSSTAAGDTAHLGVGVFDNALLGQTSIGGVSADSNSILVAVAHLGDANRNGVVDLQDLTIVANNWQMPQNTWTQGDLNRDGTVDIQDFTIVANNWQQTSGFSLTSASPQIAGTAIVAPEPAGFVLLLLGAGCAYMAAAKGISALPIAKAPHSA